MATDSIITEFFTLIKNIKTNKRKNNKMKKEIENLSKEEKSILREFVMQSKNCIESEYIKLPKNDIVFILEDKKIIVRNQHKTEEPMLYKKSDLAKNLLTNIDIGFPQEEITPEIKEEFKGKRPPWTYPPPTAPPPKFYIAGNIYGKR